MKKENNLFKVVFTAPVIIYTVVLVLIPLLYILFLSFCESDSYGGINYVFTLNNYAMIFNMTYLRVFIKSFNFSALDILLFLQSYEKKYISLSYVSHKSSINAL